MSDEEQDENSPVGVATPHKPRPPPPSPYQPKSQVCYENSLSRCTDVVCGVHKCPRFLLHVFVYSAVHCCVYIQSFM